MPAKASNIELEFTLEKETKNTVRYAEVTDAERPTVGNIYVLKSELPNTPPNAIAVTISPK